MSLVMIVVEEINEEFIKEVGDIAKLVPTK